MHLLCNNESLNQQVGRSARSSAMVLACAGAMLMLSGCDAPVDAKFRSNEAYIMLAESRTGTTIPPRPRARVKENIKSILEALFGTPDEPRFPEIEGVDTAGIVDIGKLRVSAGRVNSDIFGKPQGLYREHCAHCHGISGDGHGPTASFLNPYPRDYRLGLFKFKSTPSKGPPTKDDLHRILVNGIPGTAMPSFKLLSNAELEAIEHYVRYLAIRGQVERALVDLALEELEFEEDTPANEQLLVDVSNAETARGQMEGIVSLVGEIVTPWAEADAQATPVPPPPEDFESPESVARGRELFYGPIANCIKCHGETGLGDGVTNDYDDWTKELNPADKEFTNKLVSVGATFEPRPIRPRNLRLNVFRGGRRPVDLYWRIHNGIAGTPMPAAPMKAPDADESDPRLTPNDLWDIIAFVRSLPYDDLSAPAHTAGFQRERQ